MLIKLSGKWQAASVHKSCQADGELGVTWSHEGVRGGKSHRQFTLHLFCILQSANNEKSYDLLMMSRLLEIRLPTPVTFQKLCLLTPLIGFGLSSVFHQKSQPLFQPTSANEPSMCTKFSSSRSPSSRYLTRKPVVVRASFVWSEARLVHEACTLYIH